MIRATVSGSFHRHMSAIYEAVGDLRNAGIDVLSPADPRVVAHLGEFLFVASDRLRSIRLVQDRHFHCIASSSFLWLVAPDGYVGQSASMEIGYAVAVGTPVYCLHAVPDLTLRQYVHVVPSLTHCLDAIRSPHHDVAARHVLIDPHQSVAQGQEILDGLREALEGNVDDRTAETRLAQSGAHFAKMFGYGRTR